MFGASRSSYPLNSLGPVVAAAVAAGLITAVVLAGTPASRAIPAIVLGAAMVALVVMLQRRRDERLHLLATVAALGDRTRRDEATGVLNREGLEAELGQLVGDRSPGRLISVLVCDIDRRQLISLSIGPVDHDRLVATLARRTMSVVEAVAGPGVASTAAIGRLGDGRIALVTDQLPTPGDVERVANAMIDAMSEPVGFSSGDRQQVTINIGVATGRSDDHRHSEPPSVDRLLSDAFLALAASEDKPIERSTLYHQDLRIELDRQIELDSELRQAIADGQMEVHFQPIVDRSSRRPELFEALVRWNHPVRGMVHPGDFLPVAARSRLIVDLGRLVIDGACAQAMTWSQRAGRPISVTVNLGQQQLFDLGLITMIERALAQTGLPPHQLWVEVSEDQIDATEPAAEATLGRLRELGLGVAIDNFGASMTSLGAIKERCPASVVKIDRALTTDIATDPVAYKIVGALVALARRVGVEVVAEGVESSAQSDILGQLGVDLQQGFHFHRPGGAEDFEDLIIEPVAAQASGTAAGAR